MIQFITKSIRLKTRLILQFLLAGIVLTTFGCDLKKYITDQYQAEKSFDRCIRSFQRIMINPTLAGAEHYEDANSKFKAFLNRYEKKKNISTVADLCKKSYFLLAQLAILQSDHRSAISWYQRGLSIFPDDSKYMIQANIALANTYQQLLDLNLAAQAYQKALSEKEFDEVLLSNPQLIALPLSIARLQQLSSSNGKSIETYNDVENFYNKIVQENTDSELTFWAMMQLANSYADLNRWDNCLDIMNKTVINYPDHIKALEILLFTGDIYAEIKMDYFAAKEIYSKVVSGSDKSPVQAKAHLGLGNLLFKQNRNVEARKKMRWIIENYPREGKVGAKAQYAIAHSYEQAEQWDRALVEYRWLIDSYPLTPEGVYAPLHIANYFKALGEEDMAATAYSDATQRYYALISKYPQSQLAAIAQEYLSICYVFNEDWESAINSAEQLYKNYKTVPQIAMSSHLLLGHLYEKNSKFKEALNIYTDFVKKFSGHPLANQVRIKIKELERMGANG